MTRYKLLVCNIFANIMLAVAAVYPQQGNDPLNKISQMFETFQYENVISSSDSILTARDSLPKNTVLEIYRMKGISQYSLNQVKPAENSFQEILKIDSSFTLDSAKTSPKIISFFNDVKNQYNQKLAATQEKTEKVDTVYIVQSANNNEELDKLKNSLIRSIILPGWGHLYIHESEKGWILTALSSLTLASSVYFIVNTNTKYHDYMNTTDVESIPGKYDEYNKSYKFRNYSLIAFAAIWLYSQIDLLFISNTLTVNGEVTKSGLENNYTTVLKLQYRLCF